MYKDKKTKREKDPKIKNAFVRIHWLTELSVTLSMVAHGNINHSNTGSHASIEDLRLVTRRE